MTEAFVYDAIRTPRGKGKKDGSLHEVKPVNLLAGVLGELQRRNDLDRQQMRRDQKQTDERAALQYRNASQGSQGQEY